MLWASEQYTEESTGQEGQSELKISQHSQARDAGRGAERQTSGGREIEQQAETEAERDRRRGMKSKIEKERQ